MLDEKGVMICDRCKKPINIDGRCYRIKFDEIIRRTHGPLYSCMGWYRFDLCADCESIVEKLVDEAVHGR